ncbi:cytochrome B [Orrella sp. NBD-18]|uniref:Cytochrome B n=1 Tax=Sheuella amnicola TaxID=2707330 RepID=A0A6B2R1M3_9BURK|nr:cytochrome b/b6 domain-containing protein [Sheuella amnicola]NDY83534.1 cytochrome B [Sheuella amnicola]
MTTNQIAAAHTNSAPIRIWDLPTRLFHMAFAISVIGAIVTVKLGGLWMDWHVRLGIISVALLIFRIIWGLIGPRYARFSQFIVHPLRTVRYLCSRRQANKSSLMHAGHNPLGAWAVIAMLLIIGIQAITGLFANDDILTQGPLAQFVSDSNSATMTGLHQANEPFVYAIIALHLLAIIFYAAKGQRLIPPMIHGDVPGNQLAPDTPAARDDVGIRLRAGVLAALLGWGAWWLMQLAANAGGSFN